MKKKPSERQQEILDFINKQIEEKGYPPSVREICDGIGLRSTSTVHCYLTNLEKEGAIIKDPTKPRALKVVSSKASSGKLNQSASNYSVKEIVDIPIVGRVTAGQPILAVENIEDTFPMPLSVVQNSTVFMLKVRGESMIEAGILDNDYIVVRQQPNADNGDIVVALIDDEATVKTFYKEKDHIRLQPENKYLEPIIVNGPLAILGKVIGVFRTM